MIYLHLIIIIRRYDEEKDPIIQRLSGLYKTAQTILLMTKKTIGLVENQSSSGSSGISQL